MFCAPRHPYELGQDVPVARIVAKVGQGREVTIVSKTAKARKLCTPGKPAKVGIASRPITANGSEPPTFVAVRGSDRKALFLWRKTLWSTLFVSWLRLFWRPRPRISSRYSIYSRYSM